VPYLVESERVLSISCASQVAAETMLHALSDGGDDSKTGSQSGNDAVSPKLPTLVSGDSRAAVSLFGLFGLVASGTKI